MLIDFGIIIFFLLTLTWKYKSNHLNRMNVYTSSICWDLILMNFLTLQQDPDLHILAFVDVFPLLITQESFYFNIV